MSFLHDPNLGLVVIALINAFTALVALRTHALAKQVEIATNSMKDALVKATSEAAHAAGKSEGVHEGEIKAAAVAQGVAQGMDRSA